MKDRFDKSGVPDRDATMMVVWMAHCINFPFIPMDRNMQINLTFMSMLKEFGQAVQAGDKDAAADLYKAFQGMVQEKFGSTLSSAIIGMLAFKFCSLSKDLLDLFRMVLEGQRDEDVLSGKGSIRRILKYSIELGSSADTLNALVEFFVDTPWFDGMPEQEEWLKLALECMMATGNGDMGKKVLERLQSCGGLSDTEKEELITEARIARGTIDVSWM